MSDRIEKSIELNAAPGLVWSAITDHREFGQWFGVRLEAPFIAGKPTRGQISHPGYEHLVWEAAVQMIEPEHYFSFTWHPYAIDPSVDYAVEEPTLVEFHLEPTASGTLLRLTESGFDKVPAQRRNEAFLRNDSGWTQQMSNIRNHVASTRR